jgi:hypothetical protein
MKAIETTAIVGDDRTVTVQLPPDIAPGRHRIMVVVDGPPCTIRLISCGSARALWSFPSPPLRSCVVRPVSRRPSDLNEVGGTGICATDPQSTP